MHLKLFVFTLHIFNFFYPEINKPNIHNNIIDISSFQNGLKDLFSSTGLYLKSKVVGENMFFNFWTPLLKMYIFEVVTFFSCLVVIQSTHFSVVVHIYKIRVFDEAFFLVIIRMPMITFSGWWHAARSSHPYICMTSQRSGLVGARDKWNTYLYLQKMFWYHTKQGANLV